MMSYEAYISKKISQSASTLPLTRSNQVEWFRKVGKSCSYLRILKDRIESYRLPTFITAYHREQREKCFIDFLKKIHRNGSLPECEFILVLTDGDHVKFPVFSSISFDHWNSIPIPLGCNHGPNGGTRLTDWDDRIASIYFRQGLKYPWEQKTSKAIFRGTFRLPGKLKPEEWVKTSRGKLYLVAKVRPDLFDVGFTDIRPPHDPIQAEVIKSQAPLVEKVPLEEHQRYKILLNAGATNEWSDRIRMFFHMNSLIMLHEPGCQEFFSPFLVEGKHHLTANKDFSDLVEKVEWVLSHPDEAQDIVANGNRFARENITEKAMERFLRILFAEYAKAFDAGKEPWSDRTIEDALKATHLFDV